MKTLNELTVSQLMYLKSKYETEVIELGQDMVRKQAKLDRRLERQTMESLELVELQTELSTAETLLDHLNNTGAAASLITAQEAVVAARQKAVDDETGANNYLTDEEAQLVQMEIRETEQAKILRETDITTIDALLAA